MVSVVIEKSDEVACKNNPIDKIETDLKAMNIKDEISIHDNNNLGNEGDKSDNSIEEESPSNQLFYDASAKLKYARPYSYTTQ